MNEGGDANKKINSLVGFGQASEHGRCSDRALFSVKLYQCYVLAFIFTFTHECMPRPSWPCSKVKNTCCVTANESVGAILCDRPIKPPLVNGGQMPCSIVSTSECSSAALGEDNFGGILQGWG